MIEGFGFNGPEQAEVRQALERAAVLLTLLGGAADEGTGRELVRKVLPVAGTAEERVGTVFTLLHRLYGAAADDGRYLQGLEPDLLGEELVRQGLTKTPALLSAALMTAAEPGRRQLLTVLARLAQKPLSAAAAEDWLRQAFTEALEPLAEIVLDVAVAQGDPIGALLAPYLQQHASDELSIRLMGRCSEEIFQGSVPLRELALAATERSLEATRKKIPKRSWLARWWHTRFPGEEDIQTQSALARIASNLSVRLSHLGNHEAALKAAHEAINIRRRLARERPDAFVPDLAKSLFNLGNMQSNLAQRKEALTATWEAHTLFGRLAELWPDAFLPDFARCLDSLANRWGDLGHREAALETTQEAVKYRRQLVEKDIGFQGLVKVTG